VRFAEYILPVTPATSVTPLSPYIPRRSSKMYLEAVIEPFRRLRSSDLRHALGGHHRSGLEMHLEAEMECTRRTASMPELSVSVDTFGGHDRSRMDEYLEAVDLDVIDLKAVIQEAVNLGGSESGGSESGGGRSGGMCDGR